MEEFVVVNLDGEYIESFLYTRLGEDSKAIGFLKNKLKSIFNLSRKDIIKGIILLSLKEIIEGGYECG